MSVTPVLPLHELMNPPDNLPFEIHRILPEKTLARAELPHRHSFYQLLFVTNGYGTQIIDFEPYPLEPPVIYFLSPGQVHSWQSNSAPLGYVLLFTADFLLLGSLDLLQLSFFHGETPQLQLTEPQAASLESLIQAIQEEYKAAEFFRASVLSAYLNILLVKIQRLYVPTDLPGDVDSGLVRRFKQLVSELYLTERSISVYAERIGISASHLAKQVKAATGKTPGQIIRQAVILEAKRLLANTNLTVEQISLQLAFDDPAYFGRLFRRETDLSPGHFRQYIREKYQIPPD